LEQDGWIQRRVGNASKGRRIKSYRLTREGRRHLSTEKAAWQRIVAAMSWCSESSS
jgi:DNA-binding PadR family transcriptional regulator